jgi:N-acetylornithine carbamoyltransferase
VEGGSKMVAPKTKLFGKDFITTQEWEKGELDTILAIADQLKTMWSYGYMPRILDRKTLFMLFYNSSLRTRNSFEANMTELGGHAHFLDASTSYMPVLGNESVITPEGKSRERVKDAAGVLDRMGHALAIRIFGAPAGHVYGAANGLIREFADLCTIPVIDMDCDMYHPCQAMADLMTIREHVGPSNLKGKKFVMSWADAPSPWKPLAVAHSATLLMTRYGLDVTLAYPKEFHLDPKIEQQAKENAEKNGSEFEVVNDMEEAFEGADIVYPKGWTSIDYLPPKTKEPNIDKIKELLNKYRGTWTCDAEKMKKTNNAYYMHCLPADVKPGYEVTPEVIDGPKSIVTDEAENRLHAQRGILAATMGGRY